MVRQTVWRTVAHPSVLNMIRQTQRETFNRQSNIGLFDGQLLVGYTGRNVNDSNTFHLVKAVIVNIWFVYWKITSVINSTFSVMASVDGARFYSPVLGATVLLLAPRRLSMVLSSAADTIVQIQTTRNVEIVVRNMLLKVCKKIRHVGQLWMTINHDIFVKQWLSPTWIINLSISSWAAIMAPLTTVVHEAVRTRGLSNGTSTNKSALHYSLSYKKNLFSSVTLLSYSSTVSDCETDIIKCDGEVAYPCGLFDGG